MIIKCKKCKGSKKIKSIGMLERECDMCGGLGFIDMDIHAGNPLPPGPPEQSAVSMSRERGRPRTKSQYEQN